MEIATSPPMKFYMSRQPDTIVLDGCDDDGDPFILTLDRVYVMNLVVELEDWLCNGSNVRKAPR